MQERRAASHGWTAKTEGRNGVGIVTWGGCGNLPRGGWEPGAGGSAELGGEAVEREGARRLRRMPDSTWRRPRAADSIQSKVTAVAMEASSFCKSILRTRCGRFGFEQEQVFEEGRGGAEKAFGFRLTFGAGAVGFGGLNKSDASAWPMVLRRRTRASARLARYAGRSKPSARPMAPSERRAIRERSAGVMGTAFGEKFFDLVSGDGAETEDAGARADGGEEFAGVFGKQDDGGVCGRFFQNFEEGVGGFFHEGGAGEDGEGAAGFRGHAVDFADEDWRTWPILMRSCGGSGGMTRTSGWVWMRMRVSSCQLTEIFARGDGFVDAGVEVEGLADALAVGADATEVRESVGDRGDRGNWRFARA